MGFLHRTPAPQPVEQESKLSEVEEYEEVAEDEPQMEEEEPQMEEEEEEELRAPVPASRRLVRRVAPVQQSSIRSDMLILERRIQMLEQRALKQEAAMFRMVNG